VIAAGRPRRPAVFFDRDGTLIEDRHYLADPEGIRLVPGATAAIRQLRAAGFAVVIVTNQSGIARGLVTWHQYDAVKRRLDAMLGADGAPVDATYVCPHHPDVTGPCSCRKPGTELFTTAARDLDLDLASSYLVGDRWRDVEAALALGAHGILVPRSAADPTSDTIVSPAAAYERTRSDEPMRSHERITTVPTLADAVQQVLQAGALHLTTPPQRR
jgi:D-glycero-D-manno-heptose 1,7-bisphosphate phosphatase